jgi:hypothetical protein
MRNSLSPHTDVYWVYNLSDDCNSKPEHPKQKIARFFSKTSTTRTESDLRADGFIPTIELSRVSRSPTVLHRYQGPVRPMRYQTEWRIASASYFTVAGSILISGLSLPDRGVWYLVSAWLFLGTAIAWAWRPPVAARLSIGPVVVLAFLFRYCSAPADWLFLGGVLGIAVFFIAKTLRSYSVPKPV